MISNYDHYKTIIELWLRGGLNYIKQIESCDRTLYRLINKFGKNYSNLFTLIPNEIIKKYNTGDVIDLDLISATYNRLKSIDGYTRVKIKNTIGISILNEFNLRGYLYKNEIITYGKFKFIGNNEIELISKKSQTDIYNNLIDRIKKLEMITLVDNYTNKIKNSTNNIIENIEKIKKRLRDE